jgi:plastocyanin
VRAAVVAGVVLATPAPALADDAVVEIHGYQYHAADVTLQAGEAVTWTNGDTARHDVASTAGPEAFQSPELAEGESFTHTFTQAGSYAYLCTLHPDMVATLTVTLAPVSTAALPVPTAPVVAAPGAAATASTSTTAGLGGPVAAPVAAVTDVDLEDASRPYLQMLALVAAVVVSVGLLFGARKRRADTP